MMPHRFSLVLSILSVLTRLTNANNVMNFAAAELPSCTISTQAMRFLGPDENIDPCVLYDVGPPSDSPDFDLVVTLLQVTSTSCSNHRDGAPVSVERLNDNGRGYPIGFNDDFRVGFHLISVVAGNQKNLGRAAYGVLHEQLLRRLLESTQGEFRYIIGTCSGDSAFEPEAARDYETPLMAQVGPPGFYTSGNPWIFGFHINSDEYTRESVLQLKFYANQVSPLLPVRVIYRTSSEFFFSTCRAALGYLEDAGFENIEEILYDPSGDNDEDGVENIIDEDFLISVADQICPPGSYDDPTFRPALYMCVSVEQDVLLERFRENGCLFTSIWMTPTGWTWAFDNTDLVPYFQGAGQWHAAFTFSDDFFPSGIEFLEFNVDRVGYLGGFDMLVSYAIPTLFAKHLQNTYRIFDEPNPAADNADAAGRERLRRLLLNFRGDTIFGPIAFDDNQRNIGRGAASFQWQLHKDDPDLLLVAPSAQAEAPLVLPSPSIEICEAGNFVNVSLGMEQDALLMSKCSACPVDTFAVLPNTNLECNACPPGSVSSEDGTTCIIHQDNLLSPGVLSFGYIVMAITWCLALFFLSWALWHRKDPVVKIAQLPYLVGICLGAMIASSAIVAFAQQAGTGEDEKTANHGCLALPYLYSIGWIIQYGCVCAKTLRLWKIVEKPQWQRVTLSKTSGLWVILVPVVLDLIVITLWTFLSPLEYNRKETNRTIVDGILTIKSIGRCSPSDGSNEDYVWIFLGLIILVHAVLMFSTHWLLYNVRNVNDRYQEQKYLAIAAIFSLEVLVMGGPILIAARDSGEASYFVISAIITLDSIALLCFTFVPKRKFLRKGLAEGVAVGESILTETHKKAVMREAGRRGATSSYQSAFSTAYSGYRPSGASTGIARSTEAADSLHEIPEGDEESPSVRTSNDINWNDPGINLKTIQSQEGPLGHEAEPMFHTEKSPESRIKTSADLNQPADTPHASAELKVAN